MQQSLFAAAIAEPTSTQSQPALDLETAIKDVTLTVIDVETTGLSAKKNALTEITAIQYINGQETGKFSTLVRPTEAIPDEVIRLTGIDNEMVKDAPDLLSVLTDLCRFVGQVPIIVGHNVSFDIRFITEKLSQTGLGSFVPRFNLQQALCTKTLATRVYPGLPSYEGIVVATHCGVVNPNPHRAESDVRMSAGILFALIDKMASANPAKPLTVQDVLTQQGPL